MFLPAPFLKRLTLPIYEDGRAVIQRKADWLWSQALFNGKDYLWLGAELYPAIY
jgi:hypothetical protein